MQTHRNIAARRAERDSVYHRARTGLVALALLLSWQGMARANDYVPPAASQLPDAVQGPGADRIPPGLACTDDMDFSPEDNMPHPFDADSVSFHAHAKPFATLTISDDSGCPVASKKVDKV